MNTSKAGILFLTWLLALAALAGTAAVPCDAATLAPVRSFATPTFADPDTNVNGLVYLGGKLYALNHYVEMPGNIQKAHVYALDPSTGAILFSFFVPDGDALATDGVDLFLNSESRIEKLNARNGAVLQVIVPDGVTITGGAGGLAFLDGRLYDVVATEDCNGVSVIKVNPADGTYEGCFSVEDLGIDPRVLTTDGENLLYGTWVRSSQTTTTTFDWTLFNTSPTGTVLKSDILFSTEANDTAQASQAFDVFGGITCANDQLFVADRASGRIVVYSYPCAATTSQIVVDIKPGSYPNPVNPRSKGVIPVAVLSTDSFDAASVNPATVRFGKTGSEAAAVHFTMADVNGDGRRDLMLHFRTQSTGLSCGDTSAALTGMTRDGQSIEGSDSIKTVGCPAPKKKKNH